MIDPFALRLREATIVAGCWLTCCVGALGEVYVVGTWHRPNRPELGVLFGMAIALGVVVALLPRERIVRSRYREPFFLAWTFMDFVLIVLGTLADGGTASPLMLLIFIPVVFSSMSYPLASVLAVGILSVISYLALAVTAGGSSPAYQGAFVAALACTAGMSTWQARNHNRQHDALAEVSRSDPLTGCLNRRGFEERATGELAEMSRSGRPGAVMVLDIDHFKPINDELGHAAGDALLCWVVETLQRVVRQVDAVGRLGGDEFAVLFPRIDPTQALRGATRIQEALAERAPCSIGIAVYPDDGTNLEELTRQADMRLYASRHGRQPGEIVPVDQLLERLDAARHEVRDQALMQAVLLDQIDASVIVTDLERRVVSWNSGAESLYGWSREEALGRDAVELMAPPADEVSLERFETELRRDSRWDGEFTAMRKDGTTFTAYVRNRVICDEGGAPTSLVGVSVDISKRVAAESELLQSRDYAHAVSECMGEGLFTLDVEGRVTYINPVAEALLGWPHGELLGLVMHDVIHARRADGTRLAFDDCPITGALREGATVRIEDDLFTNRSGRALPVAYTATPFATGDDLQGCVVIFQDITERKRQEADQRRDVETLACIDRVEGALIDERFLLYAQPIVDVRTGQTVQHELLLRMRERDGTIVAPGSFLPVAEQYALVGEIDWWVIKSAAQIAAAGSSVQLNISARSIGDIDVLDHIERSIEQAGADPARLVFEITETAILDDAAVARGFAERLRDLGCKLALDDFGTGYGGFTYLKQIPVDYLKIDIEFVRDLASNTASRHVVQAVVALARDFDLQTVAEGVEDAAALELLSAFGVDYAQGYHIARPAPFDLTPGDLDEPVARRARAGEARRQPSRPRRAKATRRRVVEEI